MPELSKQVWLPAQMLCAWLVDVTFQELILQAGRILQDQGIENAQRDARLLMCEAAGFSKTDLIAHELDEVPVKVRSRFEEMLVRRQAFEPVSRIMGKREFWGMEFDISSDVLDPRADTEAIIETVLADSAVAPDMILDLGTGSGCILLALLSEYSSAKGIGVDQSEKALEMARVNADKLGLETRARFIQSNWFGGIDADSRFDVIVSNPPYIRAADIQHLDEGVKAYDPMSALDGGPDGLEPYRVIAAQAKQFLQPDGLIAFEVGYDQSEEVIEILSKAEFYSIKTYKDLSGIKRVVYARAPSV